MPRARDDNAGGPQLVACRTVATASGLNLLAGIWLIIAPFVLGYGDGDPYWNDIVFSVIVFVLALISATARGGVACADRPWYRR
jgi:SPW repeat